MHVECGSFKYYLELLLTSSMLEKGLLLSELSGTRFQDTMFQSRDCFSWKLHQAGLCSPGVKRCIPIAVGCFPT